MNSNTIKNIKLTTALVLLLLGLFYIYSKCCQQLKEPFEINKDVTQYSDALRCPNLLVQKDKNIYLYNTRLKEIPGVNPIQFSNLEEYNEFLDWQKSQGIICPVLYLQKSYNTQGDAEYKIRPSVNDPQGGLPSTSLSSS